MDPIGPASGSSRVQRGGWWFDVGTVQSVEQHSSEPSNRFGLSGFGHVGFRLARP